MLAAQGERANPHYRYRLFVDVEPVDVRMLRDALEDETLGLRERYGMAEIERQLEDYELRFHTSTTTRWEDFEADIGVLSIYLSQFIVGHELVMTPTRGAPLIRATKIVGCRGDTVRLAVHALWDPQEQTVELGEEDVDALVERWPELPDWLHNALRLKYPRLTAL